MAVKPVRKEKTWTEKFKERCKEVPYEQQCRIYDL